MANVYENWKNKNGTENRSCKCGTWKQHWINFSGEEWPIFCSVSGCFNFAELGAHVINSKVSGEKIVPMCKGCNNKSTDFNIREGTVFVDANVSNTCEK